MEKISSDVRAAIGTAEMRERFNALGVDAEGSTPPEFRAYFRSDVEKWRKVVRTAGVSAE